MVASTSLVSGTLIRTTQRTDYIRGFGYQGGAARGLSLDAPIGPGFKEAAATPGDWTIRATCFGELLPYHENKFYFHATDTDQYGIPKLVFDASLKENERKLRIDGVECIEEMLLAAGCENVTTYNAPTAPGACIHEMGNRPHGPRPQDQCAEQMEPGSYRAQRLRYRWFVHDERRHAEPLHHLHGLYCSGGGLSG